MVLNFLDQTQWLLSFKLKAVNNNYFYFNGFKFVTLEVIKQIKNNRNEFKDKNDLKLIDTIII